VDDEAGPVASQDDSSETSSAGGNDSAAGAASQMLDPDVLVSLTAPKRCSRGFRGRDHYVVQRFVPPELLRKYALGTPLQADAAAVSLTAQLSLVELDTATGRHRRRRSDHDV